MDEPWDELYKWGHERDRVALVLWTWGTLLTKIGESMGMAGSSLKENAVKDEDRVVQRMKWTTSSEALCANVYTTASYWRVSGDHVVHP